MPRTNLADLLDDSAPPAALTPAPADSVAADVNAAQPPAPTDGRPPVARGERGARTAHQEAPDDTSRPDVEVADPSPPSAADPRSPAGGPRYLQLERKELRIRLDQADQLTALTRRLNRTRAGHGDRITDNTLIRVAIDVLLDRSEHLTGITEDELRHSLSL